MKRHHYLTRRRLAELETTLSARDFAVLQDLQRLRLATGGQLVRLHLQGLVPRRQRAVLASLTERHLVVRLPRSVGGIRAGSAGYVYGLGPAGHRLLADPTARRRPVPQYSSLFLAHTLAVTETYVAVREAAAAGTFQVTGWQGEPACWRTFSAPGGGQVVLKPDAHLTIQLGRYIDSYFLEVDLATESTPRIAAACDRYRSYWQTGREQAAHGVFPKVLWLVPDAHRYEQLVAVLAKQPPGAWQLFEVAVQDEVVTRLAAGASS